MCDRDWGNLSKTCARTHAHTPDPDPDLPVSVFSTYLAPWSCSAPPLQPPAAVGARMWSQLPHRSPGHRSGSSAGRDATETSIQAYFQELGLPFLPSGVATTGGRGGGRDLGRGKGGSVGRQMVSQWDKKAVGQRQQQRHVDVSDDLEDSSSSQHSGSEEEKSNREVWEWKTTF